MRIECLDVLNRVRQPAVRLLKRFLHHQSPRRVSGLLVEGDYFSNLGAKFRIQEFFCRSDMEEQEEIAKLQRRYNTSYSGGDTRRHELQRAGYSGRNNAELHALNCRLTDALSNDEIVRRIIDRRSRRLLTGQLEAAARDRGIKFYNE